MTLREYISFWQETYDKHQSRPTTYAAHNYVFKNHILPGLGDIPLSELTSEMVGEFLEERKRFGNHRRSGFGYDDVGNDFLQSEIGDIIFTFSLEDAIKKGILCEFEYIPLPYILTDEERAKKKKIIAAFNAKKEAGEPVDEKDMFTQLSMVNKTAINKIDEFEALVAKNPNLLRKCIIFVQTKDYGELLQDVLVKY